MKLREDIAVIRSLGATPAGILCLYYSFIATRVEFGTVPSQSAMDGGAALAAVGVIGFGAFGAILFVHGLAGIVDLGRTGIRVVRYPLSTTLVAVLQIGYIGYLRSYGVGEILTFADWLPAALLLGSIATVINETWLFLLRAVRRRL